MTQDESMNAEEEVPFLVLQCKNCKSIVGDTGSLLSLQKESSIITLTRKSVNVLVDEDLETSKEGPDYGSTFNNLFCANCNNWLGRCYRTTTPELDNLRSNFTFGIDQVIMFEMETKFSESVIESQRPIVKSFVDSVELVKLQKFVVALYDRIELLEMENDTIRNELGLLNAKLSAQSKDLITSDMSFISSKAKNKRSRVKKIEKEPSSSIMTLKSLKSAASSVLKENVESIESQAALELVSWSILSGNDPEGKIKFIAKTL